MKDIVLGLELFTVYFSAACCLMHKPKKEETVSEKKDKKEWFEAKKEENPPKKNVSKVETGEETDEPIPTQFPNSNDQNESNQEWEVNFSKLSLSACRKIAGELSKKDKEKLGISQKVNRKDKPAEQLRREIRSRWRHYQEEVEPIVRSHCNAQAKIEKDKAVALTGVIQNKTKSA